MIFGPWQALKKTGRWLGDEACKPIKRAALQGMRRDVGNMDVSLGSYAFQAAMTLLASELVGPYADRVSHISRVCSWPCAGDCGSTPRG